MKKYLKWGIIISLAVIGICIGSYVVWRESRYEGYYVYPSIEDYLTPSLLVMECRIPEETLRRMTDEQLAQAVADFPLLMDVYAFSSPGQATEALAKQSDAYKELLSRRNGKEALIAKMKELQEKSSDSITIELLRTVVLDEKSWRDTLTDEEMQFLTGK